MKVEQVLQLIQAVSDSELTEFKYEEDGVKLSLKKTGDKIVQVQAPAVAPAVVQAAPTVIPAPAPVPAAPAPAAEAPAAGGAAGAEEELPAGNIVKSPLVGTFYAAPAEDAEPSLGPTPPPSPRQYCAAPGPARPGPHSRVMVPLPPALRSAATSRTAPPSPRPRSAL